MSMDKDYMREAAKAIEARLPDGHRFILLVAEEGEARQESRMFYVATMKRQSALNVMKEFLLKAGAAEDWMKHIK